MRRCLDDRGQSTAELALVLPLVVTLLLVVVQATLVIRDQILVIHAAREAVRAAAVSAEPAAARRAGERSGSLDPARLEVITERRDQPGGEVRVVVRYRSIVRVPVISRFVAGFTLSAWATMRVERD
ncbi:MAG: pilus assembly protein [Acidimicrobiales bacterium]|nr:pilus assembly protein [Acidimicrobiales bacterium]